MGVFWNLFFLSYLISPRICHRFVGYLESQAVVTYTHAIEAMEAGELPEWNKRAPQQAIDCASILAQHSTDRPADWRLADDATVLDMVYAVRADEATHRFVNNSLANVFSSKHGNDALNPFGIQEPPASVRGARAEMTAEEAMAFGETTARRAREARAHPAPPVPSAH